MRALILLTIICCFNFLVNAVQYDYMVFASFWGGSSCKLLGCPATETKNLNKKFFNIHGLWPDYYSGYPSNCDNSTLDYAHIGDDLKAILDTHWSGLISSTAKFHNHEWTKHGTCWNDVRPSKNNAEKMKSYFSVIVDYALNLDIYGILEANEVVPSPEAYNLTQFQNVFDVYWGKNTYMLECSPDKKTGLQHLNAVYNCLDLNMAMIDCPAGSSSYFKICNSSDPIYYVPIDT